MRYFENKPLLNRDKSYDCDHYDLEIFVFVIHMTF